MELLDYTARLRRRLMHIQTHNLDYSHEGIDIRTIIGNVDLGLSTKDELLQLSQRMPKEWWMPSEKEKCDECGIDSSTLLRIGEEPDYDSNTAWLCRKCIERALVIAIMGKMAEN